MFECHNYTLRKMNLCVLLAGGLGFEPRLTESESAILPLDDPPIYTLRKIDLMLRCPSFVRPSFTKK